jgi:DNA-binding transcriptional regulator YdaS (Cro superfamily)
MNQYIKNAVEIMGSQRALADALGIRPVQVFKWYHGISAVPAIRCAAIEAATEGAVTRYQLRPDVFGEAPVGKKAKAG